MKRPINLLSRPTPPPPGRSVDMAGLAQLTDEARQARSDAAWAQIRGRLSRLKKDPADDPVKPANLFRELKGESNQYQILEGRRTWKIK